MKLPSGIRSGVQQLQGHDVQGALRTGQAFASVASQASAGLFNIHEQNKQKSRESQLRQNDLEYSAAMADFDSEYAGKEFIPADRIPENITVRRTEKRVGLDGIETEEVRQDIPAYEVYADMYRDFATKTRNALSTQIDHDESRDKWLTNATIVGDAQYTKRAIASSAAQEDFINVQTDAQVKSAVDDRNYAVATHLAEDIPNENKRKEIKKAILEQQEVDGYDDLLMAGAETNEDLEDAESAIANLRSDGYDGQLSVSERKGYANSLEAATKEHEAAMISRDKREDAQIVSDTWRQIDTLGTNANEHTIQTLFDDDLISGGEMTNMLRTLDRNRQAAVDAQTTKQYVLSGNPIDPRDKDSRDAVNALYEEALTQPDADPKTVAIDTMRQFKIVPDQIISVFRANNRADAPQMKQAADMLIYAQDYAPQSLADFKDNEIDVVSKVAANMRLGMSSPDAIAAVNSYAQLSPDQKATLSRKSKEIAGENTTALDDKIGDHPAYDIPWSVFEPDIPIFMDSEYTAMVKRHLPDVGFDMAVAQNMAFADVSKRWQLTDINGDHALMKFAPQGKTEVIRRQISKQYKDLMPDGMAVKDVRIASDSLTAIQVSRGLEPTYQAFVSQDGEAVPLPRFSWDAKQAKANEKARLVAEGKKSRVKRKEKVARIKAGEVGF
ncbi:hypothetical protein JKY79_03050 [Candidatus Babeliales bacterium]|nr:hypothetical protein [Candidatus Babeliales bacterium]